MAISVNWETQVISIPQADLTLVSGTLYELDMNTFRLALKDLEDEEGMPFLDTHSHNTELTIAGTTFARTVEIINGYSVEFEDGQYSVRLTGANTNLFDVENGILEQNQVQVIPNNSAGLIVSSGSSSMASNPTLFIEEWGGTTMSALGTQYDAPKHRKSKTQLSVGSSSVRTSFDFDSDSEYIIITANADAQFELGDDTVEASTSSYFIKGGETRKIGLEEADKRIAVIQSQIT